MGIDNITGLMGLVLDCPLGANCNDCPLQEIRNLKDFEKQSEIVENMTQAEQNELINIHYKLRLQIEKDIWNVNKTSK
jgi:hypothetical protein